MLLSEAFCQSGGGVTGHLSKDILLENLSNLVEAVLEITDTDIDVTDIREYGNRCLCNAFDFDPPMFHKLAYLKFGFGRHSLMEHLLPLLLHRAPNPKLAVLIFDKGTSFSSDNEISFGVWESWELFSCEEESLCFEKMFCENIPKCLSSHLVTFHFQRFVGLKRMRWND
ncbi:hypothetical protein SO802_014652 [Lithocarpus litseifolius]|uniref:Uncharacterized protein n=1 Tax=Lithocarpus litseifolius TaxID=425828 RepID=A0AAW2CV29_9ROSI